MKKPLKKSEVLREGYIKGLQDAMKIIESAMATASAPSEEEKKHVIWGDDWEHIEAIMEDRREMAKEDPETYDWLFDKNGEVDEDALREAAYEDCNTFFEDEMGELMTAWDGEVVVRGSLGLWNGTHDVAKNFDDIESAVRACMEDYNRIYVKGNELSISASHHDGTNYFTIEGVDKGALEALNKKVYDRYDPDSDDSEYIEIYNAESLNSAYESEIISEEEYNSCIVPLGPVLAKYFGWKK